LHARKPAVPPAYSPYLVGLHSGKAGTLRSPYITGASIDIAGGVDKYL